MNKHKIFLKIFLISTLYIFFVPIFAFSQQFSDLINVSNNPDMIDTGPSIAIDRNNHVHIAWNGFYYNPDAPDNVAADIFYSNNIGGSFTPPIKISVPTDWYSREPTIAVDIAGNAHIAFRRSDDQMNIKSTDDIYYVTNAGGTFGNPALIVDGLFGRADSFGVTMPKNPYIHCNNQGHVYLTFYAFGYKNLPLDLLECLLYMNNLTGEWSKPMLAIDLDFMLEYRSYLDDYNHVHLAYVNNVSDGNGNRLYYTNNVSGEFVTPIMVSQPQFFYQAFSPDIVVDNNGNAHIVYRTPFVTPGTPSLFYVDNGSDDFCYYQPICESSTFFHPSIAIDDYGFIHIAYKRVPNYGGELFYGNNINGEFNFTSFNEMGKNWVPGSQYFALGDFSSIHFTFYDWIDSDTEIFYLSGTWPETNSIQTIKDIPFKFVLNQSFPNPFNSSTTINYELPNESVVIITIYDMLGKEIVELISLTQPSGNYSVKWSGLDSHGNSVNTGIYLYQLQAGNFIQTKKMALMK